MGCGVLVAQEVGMMLRVPILVSLLHVGGDNRRCP